MGPEVFEVVKFAALGRENVQDDVAVVLQNPSFGIATFDADPWTTASFLHQLLDLLGDGTHLASAGRSRDHKEIHDGRDLSHIEDEGVFALEIGAGLRGQAGEFAAGLLTLGNSGFARFGTNGGGDGITPSLRGSKKIQKRTRPTSLAKRILRRARLAEDMLSVQQPSCK